MMLSRVILDPTSEKKLGSRELLARPATIFGQTIGLLDTSKARAPKVWPKAFNNHSKMRLCQSFDQAD